MYTLPDVSIEMIKHYVPNYYSGKEVEDVLKAEGYTPLGWLNSGINVPQINYDRAYKNDTGSYTIMVSHQFMMYYCVDMGD